MASVNMGTLLESFPFLLHLAALAIPGWWALRERRLPVTVLVPSVFLLVWHAVVLAGGILAVSGRMDSPDSYVMTTILVAVLQSGILWFVIRRFPEGAGPWDEAPGDTERWQRILRRYLLLAFAFLLVLLTLNGWAHGPMVEDSLTYKLMRGFYFIHNGSFKPDPANPDPRIFGLPPYSSLLQCLVLVHHPHWGCLNLLGTVAWASMACGVYRLAALCGASRLGCLVAAALLSFSPCLLLQGSSENDDILAALPSLWFVPFIIHAIRKDCVLSACLAGISFGLGTGAKLYPLLFGPMLCAGVCWWLWRGRGSNQSPSRAARLRKHLLPFAVAAFTALLPLAYYNAVCQGSPFRPTTSLVEIQNKPFSTANVVRNLSAQTATALVYSVPQLTAVLADRGFITRDAWTRTCRFLEEHLGSWLGSGGHPLVDAWGESFRLAPPASEGLPLQQLFGDNNMWHGFLPWLLLPAAVWCLFTRRPLPWVARLLPLLSLSWFGAYCASNKFILDVGRYFITPLALAVPCLALFWDWCTAGGRRRWGQLAGCGLFTLVGLATVVLIWPTVSQSRYRRAGEIYWRTGRPLPVEQTTKRLRETLTKARQVNVLNSWELPLFALAVHLGERSTLRVNAPFDPDAVELAVSMPDYPTGLTPAWPWGLAGVPVEEALPPGSGFLWLGRLITGFEVWGTGIPVQRKHSPEKKAWNCVLFRLAMPGPAQQEMVVTPFSRGGTQNGLEFQVIPGGVTAPGAVWNTSEARVTIGPETSTVTLFVRLAGRTYRKEVKIRGWQTYSMEPELVPSGGRGAP